MTPIRKSAPVTTLKVCNRFGLRIDGNETKITCHTVSGVSQISVDNHTLCDRPPDLTGLGILAFALPSSLTTH